MFEAIKGVIRRWVGPPASMIVGPGILPGNDELAQRVFKRLRAVSDEEDSVALKNPLGFMLDVAMDEVLIDVNLAAARERLATLELIHTLPPRQRALLLDHVERGLTYKALAKKHGLTNKIVLRDLSRAYATIRMKTRSDDERATTVDQPGPVQSAAGSANAGSGAAAPVVGRVDGVHNDRPTDGRVPVLRAD